MTPVGFDYMAAPQLSLSGTRGLTLIGVGQNAGTGGSDTRGFEWRDSAWVEVWSLGRGTSFLPPVPSSTDSAYLLWREVTLASHFVFARLTEHGPAEPETIATIGTGTNLYAGAVSSQRRWAIAPDFKDLRAFTRGADDVWREIETGYGGRFAAAVAAINETLAVVAWEEIDGMHWATLSDDSFLHQGIVPGPGAPKVPVFRARPSGGYWMTWGSFDPSLSIATFKEGQWVAHPPLDCAYLLPEQHFSENSDMSRDDGEYPVVVWGAQVMGRSVICACVPTDEGFGVAEELEFAPDGVVPTVARDRNGDAWIAWWKFFDGIFWTHTYVTATAANVGAAGDAAGRTISWNLSEPAPETWWAVLRAGPGEAFESIARVRATQNLAMSWVDDSSAGGPLRYRIRRESVDKRYEWLSDEVTWDGATSTELALLSVEVAPNRVTLIWQGPDAGGIEATVERRTEASGWQARGFASRTGADQLRYEDSTVAPGGRYGYRLAYAEGGEMQYSAASWVDVPERPVFALEGFRPNPARGTASVAFTLPASRRATLEVMDIGGRRVFRKRLDGLAAGWHTVRLDGSRELAPGLYLVRLAFDGHVLTARGVVVE